MTYVQVTPAPFIFLLPLALSPFSIASASLFLPFPLPAAADPDPAFVRAHSSNGLTFLPLYGTGSKGSSGVRFVACRVAWPVAGGVAGEKTVCLRGVVTCCSSSGSDIGVSLWSSMSVVASSSSVFAASRSLCCFWVGKRRRGFMEERVSGRTFVDSSSLSSPSSNSPPSSGNLRKIFLPRL